MADHTVVVVTRRNVTGPDVTVVVVRPGAVMMGAMVVAVVTVVVMAVMTVVTVVTAVMVSVTRMRSGFHCRGEPEADGKDAEDGEKGGFHFHPGMTIHRSDLCNISLWTPVAPLPPGAIIPVARCRRGA